MNRTLACAPLLERHDVARDTVVLSFGLELDEEVRAGQFAMVHLGDDDEYVLPRPYSILDARGGRLDLLVKIAGRGSRHLARLAVGAQVRILAPLGNPFDLEPFLERPSILVAGGVGVVPLYMLAREIKAHPEAPAPLPLFGGRTPADLPLDLLGTEPAGPWQLWVEREAREDLRQGLVTQGLTEALDAHPEAVVATCGPTPMMQAVARICRERSHALWVCLEEQMGCGSGVCRACVIEDAREERMRTVCKEGPVFALDQIRFLPEDAVAAGPGESAGCAS